MVSPIYFSILDFLLPSRSLAHLVFKPSAQHTFLGHCLSTLFILYDLAQLFISYRRLSPTPFVIAPKGTFLFTIQYRSHSFVLRLCLSQQTMSPLKQVLQQCLVSPGTQRTPSKYLFHPFLQFSGNYSPLNRKTNLLVQQVKVARIFYSLGL